MNGSQLLKTSICTVKSDRVHFNCLCEVSCRETRNDHKLDVPLFKTAAGQKNFSLQNHHSLE